MRQGISHELRQLVRNRMEELKISRVKLAKKMSLSLPNMNNMMQGRLTITETHLQKLSDTLLTDLNHLKELQGSKTQ